MALKVPRCAKCVSPCELKTLPSVDALDGSLKLTVRDFPVFACGNEGGSGDIAMLQYCQGNKYPSFQMIINHDDSTREFFYQEKDSASLKAAMKNKWNVVSMKNDWETVFATEPQAP